MSGGPIRQICRWHRPKTLELTYIECYVWAERKVRQGHSRRRCRFCYRLFFRCEWGDRPWPRPRRRAHLRKIVVPPRGGLLGFTFKVHVKEVP